MDWKEYSESGLVVGDSVLLTTPACVPRECVCSYIEISGRGDIHNSIYLTACNKNSDDLEIIFCNEIRYNYDYEPIHNLHFFNLHELTDLLTSMMGSIYYIGCLIKCERRGLMLPMSYIVFLQQNEKLFKLVVSNDFRNSHNQSVGYMYFSQINWSDFNNDLRRKDTENVRYEYVEFNKFINPKILTCDAFKTFVGRPSYPDLDVYGLDLGVSIIYEFNNSDNRLIFGNGFLPKPKDYYNKI